MKKKLNITVYDTWGCDIHRHEDIKTGEVKWFDVDDDRFHYQIKGNREETYEQEYQREIRDSKLKYLLDERD